MNIKEEFRLALRELVYPVCVVSTYNDETRENHAITVSSVTSLSFEPPSIPVSYTHLTLPTILLV